METNRQAKEDNEETLQAGNGANPRIGRENVAEFVQTCDDTQYTPEGTKKLDVWFPIR